MPARRMFLALFLGFAAAAPAWADIWSPSTWISKGNSKKSNVSVSKTHKKAGQSLTGHIPGASAMQGLTSTPHDFLVKSKEIISPNKAKPKKSTTVVKKNSSSKNEKPSLFKSMFSPEPPPPPQTVKEWLSLKRPT
jgi:hypothetical protein